MGLHLTGRNQNRQPTYRNPGRNCNFILQHHHLGRNHFDWEWFWQNLVFFIYLIILTLQVPTQRPYFLWIVNISPSLKIWTTRPSNIVGQWYSQCGYILKCSHFSMFFGPQDTIRWHIIPLLRYFQFSKWACGQTKVPDGARGTRSKYQNRKTRHCDKYSIVFKNRALGLKYHNFIVWFSKETLHYASSHVNRHFWSS